MSVKINSVGFLFEEGDIKISGKITAAGKINLEPIKGDSFLFHQSDKDFAGQVIRAMSNAHLAAEFLYNRFGKLGAEIGGVKDKIKSVKEPKHGKE